MVLAHKAHDQTFYHHVMTPNGKRWSLLEELNDKPSDQAIQGLHVSKPCQNERNMLQSAKLLHEKQLRTHLATQNLQFFNKNLWHCPANSACKHFADLTLTSEIWFHLWNFRYSLQEMPKVETDGFHDSKNLETQHLWAKNSSANDGKFPEVEKFKFYNLRLNKTKKHHAISLVKIIPSFPYLFRCFASSPHLCCSPWVFVRPLRWASHCYFLASLRVSARVAFRQHLPRRESLPRSQRLCPGSFFTKVGCENLKIFQVKTWLCSWVFCSFFKHACYWETPEKAIPVNL